MHFLSEKFGEDLVEIVREAGELILRIYRSEFSFFMKSDGSRVTEADRVSEKFILEALGKLTPDIPAVSEEATERGQIPDVSGGCFWLVDPLDGTEGFIKKNGDFVINIGLIQDFCSVFGVVHVPLSNLTYVGMAHAGSYMMGGLGKRKKITASVKNHPDSELKVLLYHALPKNPYREEYLLRLRNVKKVMNSNALRFCRLAEGEVHLHVCFESCYEWDTAAGHAIIKGAGGNIVKLDGQELQYGKANFMNQAFVAHGQLDLHSIFT